MAHKYKYSYVISWRSTRNVVSFLSFFSQIKANTKFTFFTVDTNETLKTDYVDSKEGEF